MYLATCCSLFQEILSNCGFEIFSCGRRRKVESGPEPCSSDLCTCFQNGWECTDDPRCGCKICANPNGPLPSNSCQEPEVVSRKRKRMMEGQGNTSKLRRITTEESFKVRNIQERKSIWRDQESFLLMLCQLQLSRMGKASHLQLLAELYNTVAHNECTKCRKMTLKSIHGKKQNMKRYRNIYNMK